MSFDCSLLLHTTTFSFKIIFILKFKGNNFGLIIFVRDLEMSNLFEGTFLQLVKELEISCLVECTFLRLVKELENWASVPIDIINGR